MVNDNFDPIVYLELEVPKNTQDKVRGWLYKKMAKFILERYVQEVDSVKLEKLENKIDGKTSLEELYGIIKQTDDGFEEIKIGYLEEFKKNFDNKKIAEII
jgi:hypothetical protein